MRREQWWIPTSRVLCGTRAHPPVVAPTAAVALAGSDASTRGGGGRVGGEGRVNARLPPQARRGGRAVATAWAELPRRCEIKLAPRSATPRRRAATQMPAAKGPRGRTPPPPPPTAEVARHPNAPRPRDASHCGGRPRVPERPRDSAYRGERGSERRGVWTARRSRQTGSAATAAGAPARSHARLRLVERRGESFAKGPPLPPRPPPHTPRSPPPPHYFLFFPLSDPRLSSWGAGGHFSPPVEGTLQRSPFRMTLQGRCGGGERGVAAT